MITLRKARTIVRKTLEKSRELGLKPMSVIVVDAGGHVQAFEREDMASPGRFAIAQGKAYGSVMLGMAGTAQMAERLTRNKIRFCSRACIIRDRCSMVGG